jgi:long-chain acyl-CoA synthetase
VPTKHRTRLRTIADLPVHAAADHGQRAALRYHRDGAWRDVTYAELADDVRDVALGLVAHGIQPGDRVCILAATRPEWTLVDFAVATVGAVGVPIYATSSPQECEWILRDCDACAIVCDAGQLGTVARIRERLPALRTVIVMDPADDIADAITLPQLRAHGRTLDAGELASRVAAIGPDDPFTFVYTSGTTGLPKGCILTHDNFRFVCETLREVTVIEAGDRVFLHLPLAHVFARLVELGSLLLGATLVYSSSDPQRFLAELAETRPTYLPSVPRVFEKLYTLATATASTPTERARLQAAVQLGATVRDLQAGGAVVPDELRLAYNAADEQLFAKVRGIFGGHLKEAVTGAAPIAQEILEFYYACGVTVLEGYGMTETAAAATTSTLAHHRFGTVGRALPGTQIRTADDGELLVRGPNVFSGYHGDAAATKSALADGWLHTGDLGAIDGDGYVTITGRKKDIIITSGGKNITPALIENALRQSRWVSQVVTYGDRRPYLVAIIALDPDEVRAFAREHGLEEDIAALSRDPQVRALVSDVVDDVNTRFAPVEQIKRFHLLDHDFSHETGELTPTLKLKRRVVHVRYAEMFDALYD